MSLVSPLCPGCFVGAGPRIEPLSSDDVQMTTSPFFKFHRHDILDLDDPVVCEQNRCRAFSNPPSPTVKKNIF